MNLEVFISELKVKIYLNSVRRAKKVDGCLVFSSNSRMKMIFILLFLVSVQGFSNDELPFDFDPEYAQKILESRPQGEITPLRNVNHYKWLYSLIIPEAYRIQQESESLKSFEVHLEDSYSYFPHPSFINSSSLKNPGQQVGSMTYVGFWPMSYKYDVLLAANGARVIKVKVHFKNPRGNDLAMFANKIKQAQSLWNDSRPIHDFPYEFLFEVETDPKKAHYSLNIKDKTRGPYSVNWSRGWDVESIAHELGHMMGLADEYETLTGASYCLKISLMCGSKNSKLMPHHYYFILRRLIK